MTAAPSVELLDVELPRTLPRELRLAIRRVVAEAGGDAADALDLARVWERVAADTSRRAAEIRAKVRRARCRCADGGDPNGGQRCARCHRRLSDAADPTRTAAEAWRVR